MESKYYTFLRDKQIKIAEKLPEQPGSFVKASQYIFIEVIDMFPKKPWNMDKLAMNKNLPLERVFADPNRWDFWYVSQNPKVTIDIVLENLNLPWDYDALSRNENITWETMCANPTLPWSTRNFCYNKNFSMQIVRDNPFYDWSFYAISNFQNVSVYDVRETLHKYDWDFKGLSKKYTEDVIRKNLDLPWDLGGIISNPFLSKEFVKKYRKHFKVSNYDDLVEYASFLRNGCKYFDINKIPSYSLVNEEILCKYAASKIAKQFKESISNPKYLMCKQRLEREFATMQEVK